MVFEDMIDKKDSANELSLNRHGIFSVNVDHGGVEQAFMPAALGPKLLGFSR
jgi:hypothetical protein